jgi:hypothetical protein
MLCMAMLCTVFGSQCRLHVILYASVLVDLELPLPSKLRLILAQNAAALGCTNPGLRKPLCGRFTSSKHERLPQSPRAPPRGQARADHAR